MSPLISQIVGVAALVPALQFGQVPNLMKVGGAAKEAFGAAAGAFDKPSKGGNGKASSSSVGAAAKAQTEQKSGSYFSTMGGQDKGKSNVAGAGASAKEHQVDVGGHKLVISPLNTEAGANGDGAEGGPPFDFKGLLYQVALIGVGSVAVIGVVVQTIARLKAYAKERLSDQNDAMA